MPVPHLTRRVASRVAVIAALGLALFGGAAAPAFAQVTSPLPPVGSTACNTAVTSAVAPYQTVLNTARTTLLTVQTTVASTPVDIAQAQAAVTAAQTRLTAAIKAQTGLLCLSVGVNVGGQTNGHHDPHTTPAVESQEEINAAIDGLTCDSNNKNVQAIDKAIAARQAAHLPVGNSQRRLDAKIASLSCSSGSVTPAAAAQTAKDCGCAPTTVVEQPTTTVVTPPAIPSVSKVSPTQDDNSVATTSGNQVTTVPEGSASTGAA
jgi:hypothetical protein